MLNCTTPLNSNFLYSFRFIVESSQINLFYQNSVTLKRRWRSLKTNKKKDFPKSSNLQHMKRLQRNVSRFGGRNFDTQRNVKMCKQYLQSVVRDWCWNFVAPGDQCSSGVLLADHRQEYHLYGGHFWLEFMVGFVGVVKYKQSSKLML